MSIQLSGALVQVLAGALFVAVLVLIIMRIFGRSGNRTAVLLPLISQWLGAYVLWAFVGGLAHQLGLIQTYHPRPFAILALIGGALQYRARVHGTRWQARDVFVGGQLFWLAILIVQNAVSAFSGGATDPQILSGFRDWLGAEGFPRIEGSFPHSGVDVAGRRGSRVIAAADGLVTVARDSRNTCGLIVVIEHQPYGYRTVYCHLSQLSVKSGEGVRRGQRIGAIGATGLRAWPGYEHVHWEMQSVGMPWVRQDPVRRTVGCFDSTKVYPTDRLVFTYPVRCDKVRR